MLNGKIAVFIDGSNIYATGQALRKDIDYSLLKGMFPPDAQLSYYTALSYDETGVSTLVPLIDWLNYNGYSIVKKPTKEFIDASGRKKIKGNMDIEIAVDAMEVSTHVDHVVLFTGDGDFNHLITALQRRGVFVTVVSSLKTKPPIVADELRRAANNFIEIADLPIFNDKKKESRYG